MTISGILFT